MTPDKASSRAHRLGDTDEVKALKVRIEALEKVAKIAREVVVLNTAPLYSCSGETIQVTWGPYTELAQALAALNTEDE